MGALLTLTFNSFKFKLTNIGPKLVISGTILREKCALNVKFDQLCPTLGKNMNKMYVAQKIATL
jgi:hypothetical protein